MKALVYDGPREVVVKDVPDAKIEHPTDALVKITTTNICGSDLHMYEGRTDLEPGMVLGHENLGIVAEVGSAVVKLSPGDRVCVPFNIGCGFCRNCEQGLTADYVMLSDIFPTGWHCTRLADMQPGDSVVVYGARPGGFDGRVLGDDPGRQQGDDRRPTSRPSAPCRTDRRHPDRRFQGRSC